MAEGTPPPIRYDLMARMAPEGAIDLGALVPGTGELELEIGFGRGRFLIERAQAAPGSRVVGIEIKTKWAHLVEERRKRLGLANAVALCGDAREVLPRCGPDGSLARVFVHFPDPWWKKRHARRRVVDDDFLAQLARLMRPGGELFVQTDVEERATAMAERIAAAPGFTVRAGLTHENPYGARSNREVRAEEDGLPIFRVHATRS
jgi:tRNA (guanine-N7-)-methyltransferase